ncbi:MAG TPA: alpha/beta fold hydrolase [Pyrinomonadaceae bacterium]|nr:alpha/beta fold hydrolase [Pyrinomonadaceae bacterium]
MDFILIHGAFRGGWAWHKVKTILESKGVQVFAPSLTGAGEKSHLNSTEITLQTWTNDIVNLIESKDLRDVILVGHSQGGIVIQAVAEAISERISQMIFIDAPVLRDGECALDVLTKDVREKFGEPARNALIPPIPMQKSEDFSAAEIALINAQLTAVPTNPSFDKIRIEKSRNIPHRYIFCTKTPPFFPSSFTQKKFDIEKIEYELIDAPHDCILSHSELIAELLSE